MGNATFGDQLRTKIASSTKPDIYIGAQPLRTSILKSICLFNAGHDEITLLGIGQNISNVFECAYNLGNFPGVTVGNAVLQTMKRCDVDGSLNESEAIEFTCVEIPISYDGSGESKSEWTPSESDDIGGYSVVPLPAIEMLMSDILCEESVINVEFYDQYEEKATIALNFLRDDTVGFRIKSTCWKHNYRLPNGFVSSLIRTGMLMSPNWREISDDLSRYDDIILGVDTNILYDCVLTRQLIEGFVLNSPKSHRRTPNWILVVIPQIVMQELEFSANSRYDQDGKLTRQGRLSLRALAEIFQMHTLDIIGLSVIVSGDADQTVSLHKGLHKEIERLRSDMNEIRNDFMALIPEGKGKQFNRMRYNDNGDSIIRDQLKNFLSTTRFNKGVHFITADRINYEMSRTESLTASYYSKPVAKKCKRSIESQDGLSATLIPVSIDGNNRDICIRVNLSRVLYELATEYGELKISWGDKDEDKELIIRTDERGNLDDWVDDVFYVETGKVKRLLDQHSGIPIDKMIKIWQENKAKFLR